MHTLGIRKQWRFEDSQSAGGHETLDLASALDVHSIVANLLRRRGYADPDSARAFLGPRLSDLYDPALLPGATRAADRMAGAVRDGQPIVIYGDYDVDGVTASAILWHVLNMAGARVRVYIPHRVEEGYGLNEKAVTQLARDKPLIVTVDCGMTAMGPAQVAKDAGVDLIITDHHEFDMSNGRVALPDAHTLVHPNLPGSDYPFGRLCGAAVAFKLAWQFARAHCGSQRLPEAYRSLLLDLLAYVALGTVADVVPLVDENRILTVYGLGRIKRTRFVGLNALLDASRLREERIDAYHVGFVIGPRLNACGRMGHAREAVHLLTTAGPDEAAQLATFLTQENERRRSIERFIFDEAQQMVVEAGYDSIDHRAIVLGKAGWHPGVVGIVASRLADMFSRPVVVLNYEQDAQRPEAHGSARSVSGLSIYEAIEHCASMLNSFGGHAMAAGVRLDLDRVDEFRRRLVGFVNDRLGPQDLVDTVDIDAVCTLDDVAVELFEQIQRLAPFGRSNPWPRLCVQGVINDRPAQRIGAGGKHLRLTLRQAKRLASAVGFNLGDLAQRLPAGAKLDVVFEPKLSMWQGRMRPEMHIVDVRVRSS